MNALAPTCNLHHMAKKITILVECEVDDAVTEEDVADQVEAVLKPLAGRVVSAGTVKVISPTRQPPLKTSALGPTGPTGYESRLWEKATC